MDTNICNGFIQLITKATRIQGASRTLIDHILTNSNRDSYKAGVFVTDISDHFITFIELPVNVKPTQIKPVLKRNMTEDNIVRFKTNLSNIGWNTVIAKTNTNESFEHF